jgi:hypothetical protein
MDVPGFDGTCIVYVPHGDELPHTLSHPEENPEPPADEEAQSSPAATYPG